MSFIEDFIARGQQRIQRDPYRRDRQRWEARGDSASLINSITGLGGSGDKGAASRPNPFVLPLSWQELEALWENNGIARKIVELMPSRATRKGWDIEGLPAAEEQRLRLQSTMLEGMTWGRLYGGALGVMITEDDVPLAFRSKPRDWLKQPLDLQRVGKLHAVQVFDVYDASPGEWDDDPTGNNYRMPLTWDVNSDGLAASIHHSRVVHFRGARRPPSWRRHGFRTYHNFPDVSVLQSLWDDIRRYTDTMQGGAAIAQELRQHVLKLGAFKGQMSSTQASETRSFLQLFVQSLSTLGLAVVGPDDEYHQAQTPPSGFIELSDAAKEALSAVTGYPQVILFGDTPGGLNTDGDSAWQGFRQLIDDEQQNKLKPGLERIAQVAFAAQDRPMECQPPEDGNITIQFAALAEPSDMEDAALRDTIANTDSVNVSLGVYTAAAVARHRYGPDGFKSDPPQLTVEELAEVEFEAEQKKMMQLMPGGGMGGDPMMGEDEDGGGPPVLPAAPGAPIVPPGGGPAPGPPRPDPRAD